MSLSAWEQQVLNSIKDGLADSDPELATLLTTFTELASGEEMPAREKIRANSLRINQRSRRSRARLCWYARRMQRHLNVWYAVLLCLLVTAALIGVALALSRGGGQAAFTGSLSTLCAHSIPTPSSSLVSHGVAVHHVSG